MKNIDLTNVEAQQSGKFERPQAGGYIIQLGAVVDEPVKEYLRISYDIAEGKFKGYYTDMYQRTGYDLPKFIRSYKEKALGFFKAFIDAVEASNPQYKWNNDERTLSKLYVGCVLREEEYINRSGELKTILKPDVFLPVSDIKSGRFEVKPCKKLSEGTGGASNGSFMSGTSNYTPNNTTPQNGAQSDLNIDVLSDGGIPF